MAAKKSAGVQEAQKLKIQQVRSPIGFPRTQREVLRSLGLRRIRQVVERPDSAAVRGMVAKIPHLVQIVEE
jgi:large subunit ribosomal protein L30